MEIIKRESGTHGNYAKTNEKENNLSRERPEASQKYNSSAASAERDDGERERERDGERFENRFICWKNERPSVSGAAFNIVCANVRLRTHKAPYCVICVMGVNDASSSIDARQSIDKVHASKRRRYGNAMEREKKSGADDAFADTRLILSPKATRT